MNVFTLATRPGSQPVNGQMHYDPGSGRVFVYDGSAWQSVMSELDDQLDILLRVRSRNDICDAAAEIFEAEKLAEENEIIRHHLDRLRVAMKMVRE